MARITADTRQAPKTPRHDFGKKVKVHQRYYTQDGRQVPGVTTVVGILDKPALPNWANRMGLQGIDTSKYTGEAADTGSLAHDLIAAEMLGVTAETGDYTANQITRVQQALVNFHRWTIGKTLEPVLVEVPLVSEEHRYGGTVDFYGSLDGVPTLLDYKTSGSVWREHKVQVLGGYYGLLVENGYPVKGIRILRFPYEEADELQEYIATGPKVLAYWQVFKLCRQLYEALKGL